MLKVSNNSLNSSAHYDSVENSPTTFRRGSLHNLVRFIKSTSEPSLTSLEIEKKLKQIEPHKENRATKILKSLFSKSKHKKEHSSRIIEEQINTLIKDELKTITKFCESFQKLIFELQEEENSLARSEEQLSLLKKHESKELKKARIKGKSLATFNNYERQLFLEQKIETSQKSITLLRSRTEKKLRTFYDYQDNLSELGKDSSVYSSTIKDEVAKLSETFLNLHLEVKKGSKKLLLADLNLIADLKNIDQDTFSPLIPILAKTIFNDPMYLKIPLDIKPSSYLELDKKYFNKKEKTTQSYQDPVANLSLYMTSSYPVQGEQREGDPIADHMILAEFKHDESNGIVFAGADGCNWGENPRIAAETFTRTFLKLCREGFDKVFSNTQDAITLSLNSILKTLDAIFENTHENERVIPPSTTLLGMILKRNSDGSATGTLISLGDMKVFVKTAAGNIEELTIGNRQGFDASDPGGRLYGESLTFDGRNLTLMTLPKGKLCKGDLLLPMSDGIHDSLTFDPKLSPTQIKNHLLDSKYLNNNQLFYLQEIKTLPEDWSIPTEVLIKLRSIFTEVKIKELDMQGGSTPLAEKLINYVYQLTQSSRDFMQANPYKKLPDDCSLYPGKLDHGSIAQILI